MKKHIKAKQPPTLEEQMEARFRHWLSHYFPGVPIRVTCPFCEHVGLKEYHCHCPDSPNYHLNVASNVVCEHWRPNQGLLMHLEMILLKKRLEKEMRQCPCCGARTLDGKRHKPDCEWGGG